MKLGHRPLNETFWLPGSGKIYGSILTQTKIFFSQTPNMNCWNKRRDFQKFRFLWMVHKVHVKITKKRNVNILEYFLC